MPEQTLIELLYGKRAHANPVACVEDLTAELAGRRVENLRTPSIKLSGT